MSIETIGATGLWGTIVGQLNNNFELLAGSVLRVAWKPTGVTPIYQIPTVDSIPDPVTYTDITAASTGFSVDINTGVITALKDITRAAFLINAQVVRGQGGGTDTWGLFFESFNGSTWEALDDSTRYLTFLRDEDNDLQHLSYSVSNNQIPAGAQFRIMQICSDVSDNIGLVTSEPFANAPRSAGFVLSISSV